MGVNRGISCGSSQVFTLSERDVLPFGVLVAFSQSEVDDVDVALGWLGASDEEIIGFDVAVDDSLLVDFLNSLNLNRNGPCNRLTI